MLVGAIAGDNGGVISVRWNGDCNPPHPWLYGLHVATQEQGRGIGLRLVRVIEDLALRHGADQMSLDVDADGAIAARVRTLRRTRMRRGRSGQGSMPRRTIRASSEKMGQSVHR